jgi:hypothetical protein
MQKTSPGCINHVLTKGEYARFRTDLLPHRRHSRKFNVAPIKKQPTGSIGCPHPAILIMDVVASPECFFQGEAICFNDLVDCFVAENAPRSDILRIAGPHPAAGQSSMSVTP